MNNDIGENIYKSTRALVRVILENSSAYTWSLQGFGMLRLHLSDEIRLNIWDSRFRVPNVSMIHSHPWDFTSLVVCGRLRNIRYKESEIGAEYDSSTIIPGPKGGLLGVTKIIRLNQECPEVYTAGGHYAQSADEIHSSHPDDGTVTLNRRVRVSEDRALVCWPRGEDWVSAEPRNATRYEVNSIVELAIQWLEEGMA